MKVKVLRALFSVPFLVLILISACLWLLGRLSHTYTTNIEVPIEIYTDYNSPMWVENGRKTLHLIATADGRDLSMYRVGAVPTLRIPLSMLATQQLPGQTDKYLFGITEQSIEKALMQVQNKIVVNMITDTMLKLRLSNIGQRRVAVASNIVVNCAKGFMVDGAVYLSRDSVDVKAPFAVLDTLRSIPTERAVLDDVRGTLNGTVDLDIPLDVVLQNSQALAYEVRTVPYSEELYTLPVEVRGIASARALPHKVKVKMRLALSVYGKFDIPTVWIDVDPAQDTHYYKIQVQDMGRSIKVVSVEPSMVQYIIEK